MDQLAGLTEEARKLAFDRFRLLQPHLEDDRPLKLVAADAEIGATPPLVKYCTLTQPSQLESLPGRE